MKILWCWRCELQIPMLDEDEFAAIADLHANGLSSLAGERREPGSPSDSGDSIDEAFKPMREKYREMTGYIEPNHVSIMHHRIALYGERCGNCEKPLRTPKATVCAACGWDKDKQ